MPQRLLRTAGGPIARCVGALVVLLLPACTSRPGPSAAIRAHNAKLERAGKVLANAGKPAGSSFYACLANGYMQGLMLHQVSDECATKLVEDADRGFGGPLGNVGHQEMFDPGVVAASCGGGDPTRGQTSGYGTKPGYGSYTWGGDPNRFNQYTKEESAQLKQEAIEKAEQAKQRANELQEKRIQAKVALEAAKKGGDSAAIAKAQKEYDEAVKQSKDAWADSDEAERDAQADPNRKPVPNTLPAEESPCEQALQAAQELLRECHRTGWTDFRCRRLQARMDRCPDPMLILVDPEQGYICGVSPDPEALKRAWADRCEQRVRYDPDAPNPCVPPSIDDAGRLGSGKIGDVCNDPHAYLNPDSNDCAGTFEIQPFGQPTVQQIIVYGMNKIGGPLIVLPTRHPQSPRPGPEPRPGPPG